MSSKVSFLDKTQRLGSEGLHGRPANELLYEPPEFRFLRFQKVTINNKDKRLIRFLRRSNKMGKAFFVNCEIFC